MALEARRSTRPATEDDHDAVVETISLAFHDDPTWSWAFPDATRRQEHYRVWWGLYVRGALRYPWVLVTESCEAAAVWIPPGGTEMAAEDERVVEPLLRELVGRRAQDVLELLDRFDAAHPHERPHYYLSLLGTHPDHAGKGIGMALLADSLERIDSEHMPAYLESSNRLNNQRYERLGFVTTGTFFPPGSDVAVTTMWRAAR